jgi:hypothetical protein
MEYCTGIEEINLICEIVNIGVCWIQEIGSAEFNAGGWAFVEILSEVNELLFQVDGDYLVCPVCIATVKKELPDIGADYIKN